MHDPFSTSHYIKRGLYIFLGITAVALLFATAQYYFTPSDAISDPRELDYGLEDESAAIATRPAGYLYVYGVPQYDEAALPEVVDEETGEPVPVEEIEIDPNLYAVAVDNGEAIVSPLMPKAADLEGKDFVPGFYMGYSEESAGTIDEFHPAWVDFVAEHSHFFESPSLWNEGDVQSPGRHLDPEERPWVAYDGQPEQIAENSLEFDEIDNWQIVLRNEYTHETRIIEEAARPIWINDGADLLYLKEDGIYRYNVAADDSDLVDGSWNNLLRTSDLAAAGDNSALVMTVPDLNTIAVYTFTDAANGELLLQGMIADENTTYVNPVFSPDNRMYAVMAFNIADYDEEAERYRNGKFEFRSVHSREVAEVLVPEFDFMRPIALVGWRAEIEPYEWR